MTTDAQLLWHTSSHSNDQGGACVEVAVTATPAHGPPSSAPPPLAACSCRPHPGDQGRLAGTVSFVTSVPSDQQSR
ncbi:DUF397 domain-containing protein [Streptomyces avicenniae]|uniref:DUF397 domain-containing protein n=1 Tax=Streptomyces avicenniae TaxID=500153 RepID=UPI00167E11B9